MHEDYFLKSIELWGKFKHTKRIISDMKTIFNQFAIVKQNKELPEESILKIEKLLKNIYHEVYD